jgi:hypothetical protein
MFTPVADDYSDFVTYIYDEATDTSKPLYLDYYLYQLLDDAHYFALFDSNGDDVELPPSIPISSWNVYGEIRERPTSVVTFIDPDGNVLYEVIVYTDCHFYYEVILEVLRIYDVFIFEEWLIEPFANLDYYGEEVIIGDITYTIDPFRHVDDDDSGISIPDPYEPEPEDPNSEDPEPEDPETPLPEDPSDSDNPSDEDPAVLPSDSDDSGTTDSGTTDSGIPGAGTEERLGWKLPFVDFTWPPDLSKLGDLFNVSGNGCADSIGNILRIILFILFGIVFLPLLLKLLPLVIKLVLLPFKLIGSILRSISKAVKKEK